MTTKDELITVDEIATLARQTLNYTKRTLIRCDGFPDVAPGSSIRKRRWRRREVEVFLFGPSVSQPTKEATP